MCRFSLLPLLALACFISPAYSQVSTPRITAARLQTAAALRAVATPTDFSYLARLGDFQGAKKLLGNDKTQTGLITRYAVEQALEKGDLAGAERELKQIGTKYGGTDLWVRLSKRYSNLKRPADARRTALLAINQTRLERSQLWGDVAVRLCEVGEKSEARRLFSIVEQEFPDPGFGQKRNDILTTAARCGFDDLISDVSGFDSYALIDAYASQNRDAMAQGVIERALSRSKDEEPQEMALSRFTYLLPLAKAQFERGDRAAVTTTYREANALLASIKTAKIWFECKQSLLTLCEQKGQWELADEIAKSIEERAKKLLAARNKTPVEAYALDGNYLGFVLKELKTSRLQSFNVLFDPTRFSRELRLIVLRRIRPQALQKALGPFENKAGMYLGLARAERELNAPNWRTSLKIAQAAAITNVTQLNNWTYLSYVADEWQESGDKKNAHLLGQQTLVLFRQSLKTTVKMKPRFETWLIRDMLPAFTAKILSSCDMPKEALDLLFSTKSMSGWPWETTLSQIAKQHPAPPPQQLLKLPPPQRRNALRIWTDGLTPVPYGVDPEEANYTTPLYSRLF